MERLIGARLVYRQPSMSRLVSFEYLNRQLVWQELSEFMLFLLPLINVSKVSLLLGVWNMRWSFTPDLKDWATLLGPLGTVMSPWLASTEVCHSLPQLLYCTVENLWLLRALWLGFFVPLQQSQALGNVYGTCLTCDIQQRHKGSGAAVRRFGVRVPVRSGILFSY